MLVNQRVLTLMLCLGISLLYISAGSLARP